MTTKTRPYRVSRDTGTLEHTHNRRGQCRLRIVCGTCGRHSRWHATPVTVMRWALKHVTRHPGCSEWIEP